MNFRVCLEGVFQRVLVSMEKKHLNAVQLDDSLLECFISLSPKCRSEELEDLIYFVLDLYQFNRVSIAGPMFKEFWPEYQHKFSQTSIPTRAPIRSWFSHSQRSLFLSSLHHCSLRCCPIAAEDCAHFRDRERECGR